MAPVLTFITIAAPRFSTVLAAMASFRYRSTISCTFTSSESTRLLPSLAAKVVAFSSAMALL